ncbi:MAG: hypothetical protein J0I06_23695 [Planctomycetes bacterium]|nr:hypothetical protein [Planctomycetota bacterium]
MIRQRLADWVSTPGGRRRARDLGFLAVLFVFVGLAYGPSLKHPPRADQWCFLADTRCDHTFLDTLRHSYSYNRTRKIGPGDTDLFRPVLFALLAAEKSAFEGRLAPPQALGIAFHCAVCALFLVLVRQIKGIVRPATEEADDGPDWFTYATVAFFALNPCVQELVIWHHLHGYLLFLLLLFGSMSCLLRYAADSDRGEPDARYLWAAWGLALVSAFTYELGQIYAILAGACAAFVAAPRVGTKRAVRIVAGFATIAVGYQTLNRIDERVHRDTYEPENLRPLMLKAAPTRATVVNTARYATYTMVQPFFPSLVQTSCGGQRLQVEESVWKGRRLKVLTPALAVSFAVFGAGLVLGFAGLRRLTREPSRLRLVALALPVALYAAYGAVTVLGRMNMRPYLPILSSNSYYAYTALLFGLLAASAGWHAVGGWGAPVRRWLAVGMLVSSALGAEYVREANVMVARHEKEWARPLEAVQEFVDKHRHEPGFSFRVDYAASDDIPIIHMVPVVRLVFDEWMCGPDPRYRVTIRDGKAHGERLRE